VTATGEETPARPACRAPLARQVREDFRTNGARWTSPGFRALAVHRFGNWRMTVRPKALRAPFSVLYRMLYRRMCNYYGIELPYSVRVGRRTIIEHQGGLVVNGAVTIGDDCVLRHNTTIGVRNVRDLRAPTIGDRVDIGAGAVIIGDVTIGDDATIGANAVVTSDVPAGATAVGVPARVIDRRAF
jgi:serine O-acetyltransferase